MRAIIATMIAGVRGNPNFQGAASGWLSFPTGTVVDILVSSRRRRQDVSVLSLTRLPSRAFYVIPIVSALTSLPNASGSYSTRDLMTLLTSRSNSSGRSSMG